MGETRHDETRREVLRTGAALAAAGGLVFGDWGTAAEAAALPRRTLGRTRMSVTTVTFGAIQLRDATHERVLDRAIDQGMNLIHISPGYTNGRAMEIVGRVMRRKRNAVLLALKVSPTDSKINDYLRQLHSDRIDILIPNHEDPGRMNDAAMKSAFARLKQQGKIRASGFATHTNMAASIRAAASAGFWDVCLVKYTVGNRGQLDPVLKDAAKRAGMGFLAMKSSEGLNKGTASSFQAGLRGLLTNTSVTSLTLGMSSLQQVDQNVAAVRQKNARADREFEEYAAACAGAMCNTCGRCQTACTAGVAVDEYLRAALYRRRGDGLLADELVASLPPRRSLAMCNHCGLCNGACDRKLDVLAMLREGAG